MMRLMKEEECGRRSPADETFGTKGEKDDEPSSGRRSPADETFGTKGEKDADRLRTPGALVSFSFSLKHYSKICLFQTSLFIIHNIFKCFIVIFV